MKSQGCLFSQTTSDPYESVLGSGMATGRGSKFSNLWRVIMGSALWANLGLVPLCIGVMQMLVP